MSVRDDPTPEYVFADAENFHTVMGLLRDMQMEHGLCKPRRRMACTNCNARDRLSEMLKAYQGPRVVLSGAG